MQNDAAFVLIERGITYPSRINFLYVTRLVAINPQTVCLIRLQRREREVEPPDFWGRHRFARSASCSDQDAWATNG
jgi:hypothetical protein